MKKILAVPMAAALVAGVFLTTTIEPAEAGKRTNAAAAAAIGGAIGLAAGVAIGSAAAQPTYVAPAPAYRRAPPRGAYAPWSPAWYQYCANRYVSFNPRTGYYVAHSGRRRFCQ